VKPQGVVMSVSGKKESRVIPSKFRFFHPSKENILEMVRIVHLNLLRKVIDDLEKRKLVLSSQIESYQYSLDAIAHNLTNTQEAAADFNHINDCLDMLNQAINLLNQVDSATSQQIAEVEKKLVKLWSAQKDDLQRVFSMPNAYCKRKAASCLKIFYEKEIQFLQDQLAEVTVEMNTLNSEKQRRLRKQQIYQARLFYRKNLLEQCERELSQKKDELKYYCTEGNKQNLTSSVLSLPSQQDPESQKNLFEKVCKPH